MPLPTIPFEVGLHMQCDDVGRMVFVNVLGDDSSQFMILLARNYPFGEETCSSMIRIIPDMPVFKTATQARDWILSQRPN